MIAALLLVLAAGPSEGTVTLSLSDAKTLLTTKDGPAAPISAAVTSQKLSAQVTGEALEVTASFLITVLDSARWSRLSLIKLDPTVTLREANGGEGMLVTAQKDEVVFISRQVGTYAVELKLSVRGAGNVAHLSRGADAREGVMHVEVTAPEQTVEQSDVLSNAGVWTVRWKGRTQAAVAVVRPPMEPVVASARVQMVTTVEGRARMTVEYRLGLDREQALGVRLPADWVLTRVSANGAARAVPPGREVSLQVGPESAGVREGVVELTLERDFGVFHLSGRMNLSLPAVSWPTSVVDASVHLPNVFEYRRLGGSLEPTDSTEWTPPTMPGKALRYRQHLVALAGPTLELRYAVDLENRYFRARR